jgi:Spy/CpxP family protein refolding chaperone
MRQMAPELQRLADSTRAELRQVLTPEQWDRMQQLRSERTGRRMRR